MKGELKMKIILSVILSLVFIAASSACARGTTPSGGTTGSSGDTVSTVGTERPAYRDNLPERDFDGHTFYVLTGVHGAATTHSFYTEETSDALELAFYKRNQAVAARFNLDFYEDDSGNCQKIDTLRTNVSSGDKTVDLYMLWDRFAFSAAQEALVYSIEELEYVDLSNPWWAQKINSQLSFDGKLWFAVGDENPVLMTGCGAPGAPGIIRCLRKNGERDIRIVAVDRNENAGARDLVDAFYSVPSAEKEDFLPAVLDICRRESVQVVIPIVTRELMKFARARAEFEALGAKVSVMEPDKLEIVNNKAHLLDAMRAHGLRTPEYRRVHTVEKLKATVSALGYPEKALCVKAAVGNGSRGIRMLNANISRFDLFFEQKPNSMFISYEELIRTLSERETMPEMLVMEYLPGTEYSVDFLADHGEPVYTVSRRGLSVVTSNMMSLVVDDNPAVKEICTQVVRSLELDGNFGFDLLYNANDETPYVIEINPRLTAGVVSCAAAGVNLPYLGMKRLLGEPLPELTPHFGTRMSRRYQEAFFDAAGNRLDW